MIRRTKRKLISFLSLEKIIREEVGALHKKVDEELYTVHLLKNSSTVKTGEHAALTRIFTGQYMYIDTRDISVAPHLMMSGIWEEPITNVFRSVIKDGDTVLDLGANFGYFGIIAGTSIGENGRLLFVEANPNLVPYISKSLSVNGLIRRSSIANVAISNTKGMATFNFLEDSWGSSGLMSVEDMSKSDQVLYENRETITVKTDTVDRLCAAHDITRADIIKLDIEGYEPQALKGMKKIIKASNDLKMFIEFAPNRYANAQKFFNEIKASFRYVYVIAENSTLKRVDTYEELQAIKSDDWSMLLASKQRQKML